VSTPALVVTAMVPASSAMVVPSYTVEEFAASEAINPRAVMVADESFPVCMRSPTATADPLPNGLPFRTTFPLGETMAPPGAWAGSSTAGSTNNKNKLTRFRILQLLTRSNRGTGETKRNLYTNSATKFYNSPKRNQHGIGPEVIASASLEIGL
jgi:hypothetical protein